MPPTVLLEMIPLVAHYAVVIKFICLVNQNPNILPQGVTGSHPVRTRGMSEQGHV